MNWYKKSSHQDIVNQTDFIGYHCQQSGFFDGEIINDNNYPEDYYNLILDALPYELRDKAFNEGLLDGRPEDQYTDEFALWSEKVHDFLWDNGIRWIFVSQNVPLGGDTRRMGAVYGDHCYYVLLPDNAVLWIIDDIGVNDVAFAYLYDSKIANPQMVSIPEENWQDFPA